MATPLPRSMRPVAADWTPLPPIRPVAPYAGMSRRIEELCARTTAATGPDQQWDKISATGRRVRIPRDDSGRPMCGASVALALADLRDTMNADGTTLPPFCLQGDRLWHLTGVGGRTPYHPIASVQSEFGIVAAEHMGDIEAYVRHAVYENPQARIVMGVRFSERGVCRTGGVNTTTKFVRPGDPEWELPWALDFSEIDYDERRIARWRSEACAIVAGDNNAEMLARIVAAPACQSYQHGFGVLTGTGGNGKGSLIEAMADLYGPLAAPFDLACLLGVSRGSSTMHDQSTVGLLTGLLAYDTDAVDPAQGASEMLKKAAAGEPLSMRLLQQNVATDRATAFMVVATNQAPTFDSLPSFERRVWLVAFREQVDEDTVRDFRAYLGDGSHPDDGIIDALIAGADSFARQRPDPKTVSRLISGLDDYGKALLDRLMTCNQRDNGNVTEPWTVERARVPVSDGKLPAAAYSERRRQWNMMGLSSGSLRDVHGDHRTRQMIYVADPLKFQPFAEAWHRQQAANQAEADAEERRAREETTGLVDYTRRILLNAVPCETAPGVAGQVSLLRTIDGLDGTLIVPTPAQWRGKGVMAHWRDDPSIRRDMRSCGLDDLPDRCAFSPAADVIIVDLDGADGDGVAALARVPGMTPAMFDTLAMRTPHGVHLVYRLPEGLKGHVKASTRVHGEMVDLRPGGRSYVIAPGSRWSDEDGDHAYPGIIRLPMPDQHGRRQLPVLPVPLRRWLESAGGVVEIPQSASGPTRSASTGAGQGQTVSNMPTMRAGCTHNPLRDCAYRIAQTAREQGWSRERVDAEMLRLRSAVPAGHDPRDTEECIRSALRKAGF